MTAAVWWWMTACAASGAPVVLTGAHVVGHGAVDVELRDGRIAAIGQVDPDLPRHDLGGRWLAPSVADSHVHLSYWPVADALRESGVALAVDLAAPLDGPPPSPDSLDLRWAGPMITAQDGYPTRSWGAGGYGLQITTAGRATAAVDALHAAGATMIKVPLGVGPDLSDAALAATVDRAHALGLPVVAHALSNTACARAAEFGVDILAHTPTETLSDATVAAWSTKTVISTLAAFGASDPAVDNLRRLAAGGTTVLYGTDLGNNRTAGVDAAELAALAKAGLDGTAVSASLTSAPRTVWSWTGGVIEVGAPADLMVLTSDPRADPSAWASPDQVIIEGRVAP